MFLERKRKMKACNTINNNNIRSSNVLRFKKYLKKRSEYNYCRARKAKKTNEN